MHAGSVPWTNLNPHDASRLHRFHRLHGLSNSTADSSLAAAARCCQHLAISAHGKHQRHILPSWLSSPSWPRKHAAVGFWQIYPEDTNQAAFKFNCFSLSHVRSMPAESFTFTCIFRSSSQPKPQVPRRAFIAFIAFMGAMTTGAGSVRERDVA